MTAIAICTLIFFSMLAGIFAAVAGFRIARLWQKSLAYSVSTVVLLRPGSAVFYNVGALAGLRRLMARRASRVQTEPSMFRHRLWHSWVTIVARCAAVTTHLNVLLTFAGRLTTGFGHMLRLRRYEPGAYAF